MPKKIVITIEIAISATLRSHRDKRIENFWEHVNSKTKERIKVKINILDVC